MRTSLRFAASGTVAVLALAVAGCTGGAPGGGNGRSGHDPLHDRSARGPGRPRTDGVRPREVRGGDGDPRRARRRPVRERADHRPDAAAVRRGSGRVRLGHRPRLRRRARGGRLLYPLTDAYEEYDWPVYDFAKERVTFDGKIVGIPSEIETIGLFYNKDLFAELGIDEPAVASSDLMDACEDDRGRGHHPDRRQRPGGLAGRPPAEHGARQRGRLREAWRRWSSGETSLGLARGVDALEAVAGVPRRRLLPASPVAVDYDNANALFYSGEAAIDPDRQLAGAGDRATTPTSRSGTSRSPRRTAPGSSAAGSGSGLFINADTKNAEAALEFLDFLASPEHGAVDRSRTRSPSRAFPIDTERHRGDAAVHAGARGRRQDRRRHRRLRLQHRRAHERHVQRGDARRHRRRLSPARRRRRGRRRCGCVTAEPLGSRRATGSRGPEPHIAGSARRRRLHQRGRAQPAWASLLVLPADDHGGASSSSPDGQRPLLRRSSTSTASTRTRRSSALDELHRAVQRPADVARAEEQRHLDHHRHDRADGHRARWSRCCCGRRRGQRRLPGRLLPAVRPARRRDRHRVGLDLRPVQRLAQRGCCARSASATSRPGGSAIPTPPCTPCSSRRSGRARASSS